MTRLNFANKMLRMSAKSGAGYYTMAFSRANDLRAPDDPLGMGRLRSWVPILNKTIWFDSGDMESGRLFAYIFLLSEDKSAGYVRVPDYDRSEERLSHFEKLIEKFEIETELLVLDQVNNAGGSMHQMYAIASMLALEPMEVPRHTVVIDDELIEIAKDVVAYEDEEDPERVKYCKLLISERSAGRGTGGRNSTPLYLDGVGTIEPNKTRYTKPIVILNNVKTASAAEYLAAILQDNNRATVFGETSAGAANCPRGAPTASMKDLMQRLNMEIQIPWTSSRRTTGDIIENLGIAPDAAYQSTDEDIRSKDPFLERSPQVPFGFQGYRRALLGYLNDVVGGISNNPRAYETPRRLDEDAMKNVIEKHQLWRNTKGKHGEFIQLRGADLSRIDLSDCDLQAAFLSMTNLEFANLENAKLGYANLQGANLRKAILSGADLGGTCLRGTNLSGANLENANLKHAFLYEANLSNANLEGVDLTDATLSGADLRGAVGLRPNSLSSSYIDPENTALT